VSTPEFREEQTDVATQKMLDGAAQAFVALGVSGAGMGEIARYAGCSRGTLYRYFKNRHELHLAFVNDRAMRLVAELRLELQDIGDPAQQLCEYILRAVQKVRRNPEGFGLDPAGAPEQLDLTMSYLDEQREQLLANPAHAITYERSDGTTWELGLDEIVARAVAFESAYNPNDCPQLRWAAPEVSNTL
jgi:AcrR family transcriptional regulator